MTTFNLLALAQLPNGDKPKIGRVFARTGLSALDAMTRLATVKLLDPNAFVIMFADGDTQERVLDPKWFREAVAQMA